MTDSTPQRAGGAALLTFAATIVVIAGLRASADLILPLLVALFLAMVVLPLMNALQRRRVPGGLAAAIALVVELGVLSGVVFLVGGSIRGFTEAAPRYQVRLRAIGAEAIDWLAARGVVIERDALYDLFDPGMAFDMVGGALRGIAGALSQTLIVVLIVLFVLIEAAGFPDKLRAAFGRASASERFDAIRHDVMKYLGIKTAVSLATGTIVGVAVAILGVDFPVLWGLLAFLLNYIPSLGSILAAIPPSLLALVQYGVGRAIAVALLFLAVNVVLGNFLEPRLMGRKLGLSTLVVFLSLIFWGWVWGPVGMLFSVPLTMVVKIMLENTRDLRWIAVLLGDRPSLEQAP
jgi:predicted PurR-regulated permease PerM